MPIRPFTASSFNRLPPLMYPHTIQPGNSQPSDAASSLSNSVQDCSLSCFPREYVVSMFSSPQLSSISSYPLGADIQYKERLKLKIYVPLCLYSYLLHKLFKLLLWKSQFPFLTLHLRIGQSLHTRWVSICPISVQDRSSRIRREFFCYCSVSCGGGDIHDCMHFS